MLTQKIWEFTDEQFEQMWKIFKEVNIEWLQQKQPLDMHLCELLCPHKCKLCILKNVLSKQELLEDLENG